MYRALHAGASVGPRVPNVGQLDRPQHGLDEPDSAVGEVVTRLVALVLKSETKTVMSANWSYVERRFLHEAGGLAL